MATNEEVLAASMRTDSTGKVCDGEIAPVQAHVTSGNTGVVADNKPQKRTKIGRFCRELSPFWLALKQWPVISDQLAKTETGRNGAMRDKDRKVARMRLDFEQARE